MIEVASLYRQVGSLDVALHIPNLFLEVTKYSRSEFQLTRSNKLRVACTRFVMLPAGEWRTTAASRRVSGAAA